MDGWFSPAVNDNGDDDDNDYNNNNERSDADEYVVKQWHHLYIVSDHSVR